MRGAVRTFCNAEYIDQFSKKKKHIPYHNEQPEMHVSKVSFKPPPLIKNLAREAWEIVETKLFLVCHTVP